jgi:hypothetical protein
VEEQSQQADVADLARFGYKQELRLAQAIEDQSLEWANGVDYGLAASVWTRDVGRALRMACKLQFGSLEEYTQIKHVMASHD